jgi:hypothetical protein
MMKLFLLHRYILDEFDRQYHVCIVDTMYLHLQSKRLPHLDLWNTNKKLVSYVIKNLPIHIVNMAGR